MYLTLVAAGVVQFERRYLQRPVARVAPCDRQAIVIGISPVAHRQQLDTVIWVLHPRYLFLFKCTPKKKNIEETVYVHID